MNKTIVERLNELIEIKGGDTKGKTISQCLGLLNTLEQSEAESLSVEDEGADASDSKQTE